VAAETAQESVELLTKEILAVQLVTDLMAVTVKAIPIMLVVVVVVLAQ
jgi:hypothetical protein